MSKLKIIQFLLISSLLPVMVFAATVRDNQFCPYYGKIYFESPTQILPTEPTMVYTNGQPLGNPLIQTSTTSFHGNGSTQVGCLDVFVGRKNSKPPVNFVKQQANNLGVVINQNTSTGRIWVAGSDNTPDELNFAIQSTLIIEQYGYTYRCPNFLIGQGNSGAYHNWWVFNNYNDNPSDPSSISSAHSIKCFDTTSDPYNTTVPSYFRVIQQEQGNSTYNIMEFRLVK